MQDRFTFYSFTVSRCCAAAKRFARISLAIQISCTRLAWLWLDTRNIAQYLQDTHTHTHTLHALFQFSRKRTLHTESIYITTNDSLRELRESESETDLADFRNLLHTRTYLSWEVILNENLCNTKKDYAV